MQRPLLGFSLALITAMTWGALAIIAQQVLSVMNAQTLVWYRLCIAGGGLLLVLGFAKKLPKRTAFNRRILGLIVLGVVGLSANFFLFSYGLNFISPTTSQVLWQIAPFTMLLCGVLLFKEKFGWHQKIGLVLLIIGLIAFFNEHFSEILQFGTYTFGIFIGASAAIVWVLYAIAQKLMLEKFSSQQILMTIYLGCTLLISPFADFGQISQINNSFLIGCFIFCCLNTLIGYGAYAEALNHWDASKVSVVTILVPIFTMLFSSLAHWIMPERFSSPDMNLLSYIGAFIVVSGTILSAVGHKLLKK
ncbi:EamA family transporter [Pasteurellaceae bacterium 15-036681]|nr:EamA family transporter [Pasteurellaceae bacterium 15-036681]